MKSFAQLLQELDRASHIHFGDVSVRAWWQRAKIEKIRTGGTGALLSSALLGAASPLPSYAFAAGYQMAICWMMERNQLPRPPTGIYALAASEAQGAHPRAIRCLYDPDEKKLTGQKSFVTMATITDTLLVVALRGKQTGSRPDLAVVKQDIMAPGIKIGARLDVSFMPEIEHCPVAFWVEGIQSEQVLPGDGYSDWLKPFRAAEDASVAAALCGWIWRAGRDGWLSGQDKCVLAALLYDLLQIESVPETAEEVLFLDDRMLRVEALVDRLCQKQQEDTVTKILARDRKILQVAASIRTQRRQKTIDHLFR